MVQIAGVPDKRDTNGTATEDYVCTDIWSGNFCPRVGVPDSNQSTGLAECMALIKDGCRRVQALIKASM